MSSAYKNKPGCFWLQRMAPTSHKIWPINAAAIHRIAMCFATKSGKLWMGQQICTSGFCSDVFWWYIMQLADCRLHKTILAIDAATIIGAHQIGRCVNRLQASNNRQQAKHLSILSQRHLLQRSSLFAKWPAACTGNFKGKLPVQAAKLKADSNALCHDQADVRRCDEARLRDTSSASNNNNISESNTIDCLPALWSRK